MQRLDGDGQLLSDHTGNRAKRDIVQFVEFKDFITKGQNALAEEVLAEVPDQLVDYMMQNQIAPQPVQQMSADEMVQNCPQPLEM